MATATWPVADCDEDIEIAAVEDNVELVNRGVKIANRTGLFARVISKAALMYFFSQAINSQRSLIDKLNGAELQKCATPADLSHLAEKIEHLVTLNDNLLVTASPRTREFGPWMGKLAELRTQRDTLESLAESFRAAADPECQSLLVETLQTLYA
jgi:hypothetical protein